MWVRALCSLVCGVEKQNLAQFCALFFPSGTRNNHLGVAILSVVGK